MQKKLKDSFASSD